MSSQATAWVKKQGTLVADLVTSLGGLPATHFLRKVFRRNVCKALCAQQVQHSPKKLDE